MKVKRKATENINKSCYLGQCMLIPLVEVAASTRIAIKYSSILGKCKYRFEIDDFR